MAELDDDARFHPQDPTALVVAAFVCPLCLRRASMLFLIDGDGDYSAHCHCIDCERGWGVAMTADQFLRVTLVPSSDLLVIDSPYAGPRPPWLFSA